MKKPADYWIAHLDLKPHPEGGYFRETYRSVTEVGFPNFPAQRSASTAIYFLLTKGNFSAFHKIKSDEMWHFYAGTPLSIYVIHANARLQEIKLGLDLEKGEVPQATVPANCWFASKVRSSGAYSLVGCTVAPGFDFEDFEMAKRSELMGLYPNHSDLISSLTRA